MGALSGDMMNGGTPAMQARAINGNIVSGLTATGTVIGDALDMKATINVFTTVASGTGGQLPSMNLGDQCEVYNAGANALKVYPDQTTVGINQTMAGSAISLSPNTGCKFRKVTATLIVAYLSA